MKRREVVFNPDLDRGDRDVKNALARAGLSSVEAPKKGTQAHQKLMEAAQKYMAEVRKIAERRPISPQPDSENYFSRQKLPPSSSDTTRREYHDQLSILLLGKKRTELSNKEAHRISDFAACVTGNEEYVGTFQSRAVV